MTTTKDPLKKQGYNRTYYERHKEQVNAATEARRKKNPKQRLPWDRTNRRRTREKLVRLLAATWGDREPRCQIGLTPGTPVSDLPCRGRLEVDHLIGGGSREYRRLGGTYRIYRAILRGDRDPKDYRLLCMLHQLWNRPGIETTSTWEGS